MPLGHVFPYLNLQMLLGKHLGVKGSVARLLEQSDPKVMEINETVAALERQAIEQRILRAHGLYRFYEAAAEGDDLLLLDAGREIARFRFPRQPAGERLCLSDYVREQGSGERDYVALFAVTCGGGVRELSERWKAEGRFLDSHILQALAIEGAEAFAELLHRRLRDAAGGVRGLAQQAAAGQQAGFAGLHAVELDLAAVGERLDDAHRAREHEREARARRMRAEHDGPRRDLPVLPGRV